MKPNQHHLPTVHMQQCPTGSRTHGPWSQFWHPICCTTTLSI